MNRLKGKVAIVPGVAQGMGAAQFIREGARVALTDLNAEHGRALALELASDESSHSTGSEFVVDGGITAQ